MKASVKHVMRLLRRSGYSGVEPGRWAGETYLTAVRRRIAGLDAACPPELIRDAHLELLAAFGQSIGSGFRPWPVEPPTEDLIIVAGRFDQVPGEPDFRLWLQPEEVEDGEVARVAWLIDLYLPEHWRRRGAGTALMAALLELWERVGVGAARATATAEGHPAYLSWGFEADPRRAESHGLPPVRVRLPRGGSAERPLREDCEP